MKDKIDNPAILPTQPTPNSSAPSPFLFQQDIAPGAVTQQKVYSGGNAKGDMYYGKDGVRFDRLVIGSTGQMLIIIGGVPTWATFPATGIATAKPLAGRFTGDLYYSTDTKVLNLWDGSAWKTSSFT